MNDRELITELKNGMIASIRRKDVAGSVAAFADHTVMFILAPPLRFKTGVNAPGANGVEEWFATFEGEIGLEYREFEISVGTDLAFTHCIEHLSGRRTDGTESELWYRETLGLRKIDGAWKITHQHQSVPLYMDGSDKAATDLKP